MTSRIDHEGVMLVEEGMEDMEVLLVDGVMLVWDRELVVLVLFEDLQKMSNKMLML